MSGDQREDNSHPQNDRQIFHQSSLSLSSSMRSRIKRTEELKRSWLFLFCAACNESKDPPGAWQPRGWRRACPRPFCPSYHRFSRILCLALVGLLTWGVVYTMIGHDAAPGGQLFGLAALAVVAHLAGWAVTLVKLPALVGMLLTGIIMQNVGLIQITGKYITVVSHLRKVALVIILTRAGLNLDSKALKTMKITLPKVDLIPWTFEVSVLAVAGRFILDLPWNWGFLLGSIVTAVSPAVVVPCLFNLGSRGYGIDKGIPTLLIAIAGIDGVASIVVFGILQSVMFSGNDPWDQILLVPLAIFGGLAFGLFWGILSRFIPEKNDPFVVQLRVLMLLGAGLLAAFGSRVINLEGAGPLAVVTAAFISCYYWQKDGWTMENNPVSVAFEVFWKIFEPILFSVTGTQVILSKLDSHTLYLGTTCLFIGVIARMIITLFVAAGSNFNFKEKMFIALACMAKATVQAALGPALLDKIEESSEEESKRFGDIVLVVCFLSIILTAPLGAFIIMLSGPKLLEKTPDNPDRSHSTSAHDAMIEHNGLSTLSNHASSNPDLPKVASDG